MKTITLLSIITVFAVSLPAAITSPKDEVTSAIKALSQQANYSWKATVAVPATSTLRPGITEGKTAKFGFTEVTLSSGEVRTEFLIKGQNGAILSADNGWQTLDEAWAGPGRGRFLAIVARNFKPPTEAAAVLAESVNDLEKGDEFIAGNLTAAKAEQLLLSEGASDTKKAPKISLAKGSVKFWIKDGLLAKYEYTFSGNLKSGDRELEVNRDCIVEISNVGTTTVTPAADAMQFFPAN